MTTRLTYCCAGWFLLCLMLMAPRFAHAAWPADPNFNLPICTAPYGQFNPAIVSDGAGGAIMVWQDFRSDNSTHHDMYCDIYAEHVLARGMVDPAWPVSGVPVCTATNNQESASIVTDGAGGCILVWQDFRSGIAYDIYAQHVMANGAVDPAWPADGQAVCAAVRDQRSPKAVPDGIGGVIVTWQDCRVDGYGDIYAQHISPSGVVDSSWPTGGLAVATGIGWQQMPHLVADGDGGVIISWTDNRSGSTFDINGDIYAQHVLAWGAVDPGWPVNGRAICTAPRTQSDEKIVSDNAGGAIIAWTDDRTGTTSGSSTDGYAQHLLADGTVDPSWPYNGRALCTESHSQEVSDLVPDGAGGAIAVWADDRSGDFDVYAQHVLTSGLVDPEWQPDGNPICVAAGRQSEPVIVADGGGGQIVTWIDGRRFGNSMTRADIFSQHLLPNGAVDSTWTVNGIPVCTASNVMYSLPIPSIATDGEGGAIIAWNDYRNGTSPDYYTDMYAQRVLASGRLGGGILGVSGASSGELQLAPVIPNPWHGGKLTVQFTLNGPESALIDVVDMSGRRIVAREVGSFGAGHHSLDLGVGQRLAPGLYFVRLRQREDALLTRVAVVR